MKSFLILQQLETSSFSFLVFPQLVHLRRFLPSFIFGLFSCCCSTILMLLFCNIDILLGDSSSFKECKTFFDDSLIDHLLVDVEAASAFVKLEIIEGKNKHLHLLIEFLDHFLNCNASGYTPFQPNHVHNSNKQNSFLSSAS
jgi:hypothetical protein